MDATTFPTECSIDWGHHTLLRDVRAAVQARSATDAVRLRVLLQMSAGHMRIPLPREPVFGRTEQIMQVVDALVREGARVLVHGSAGVGKDTLVAAALRSDAFRENVPSARVSAWLHGSTAEILQRQLMAYFRTHQPRVLLDPLSDQERTGDDALRSIRKWLECNDGWLLVVEDATWGCSSLALAVPLETNRGRVVVTSKEVLVGRGPGGAQSLLPPAPRTFVLPLRTLETPHSVEIWRHMSVFRNPSDLEARAQELCEAEFQEACGVDTGSAVRYVAAPPSRSGHDEDDGPESALDRDKRHEDLMWTLREQQLQSACARTGGQVTYEAPSTRADGYASNMDADANAIAASDGRQRDGGSESSESRSRRCERMIQALRDVCEAPQWTGPTERRGAAMNRLRASAAMQWAELQLGRPDVVAFLEHELGNLPLSVKLVGRMLKKGGGAHTRALSHTLMREFVFPTARESFGGVRRVRCRAIVRTLSRAVLTSRRGRVLDGDHRVASRRLRPAARRLQKRCAAGHRQGAPRPLRGPSVCLTSQLRSIEMGGCIHTHE